MKKVLVLLVFVVLGLPGYQVTKSLYASTKVVVCDYSETNGGGFTTSIESVVDNCDGTHTIVLRVEHDGCGGPSCKELSHFSVEAIPGTYSDVSVDIREGQMSYGSIDLGPNLGSDPFDGFKIDNTKKIGGGRAGIFAITYTLEGGLQDQRASAKAGNNAQLVSFEVDDFEYVMNCNETACDDESGLSGKVFHDVDGLNDYTVDGAGIGSINGNVLFANLLTTSGTVIKTTEIENDGSYSFEVSEGTYRVLLSTIEGTIGAEAPQNNLPSGWVHTGENVGSGSGSDGNINGLVQAIVSSGSYTEEVNFGIQQLPVPDDITLTSQENPGGSNSVEVPSNAFIASDPDGELLTISITGFPANANSITINGTTYTASTFPTVGVVIPTNSSGQPTQTVLVDPVDGVVTVSIPFKPKDNAGFESVGEGSVNIPFTVTNIPGGLSGTVFHDSNGLSDEVVNGVGIGNTSGTNLYANLLDNSENVLGSVQIGEDGTYAFDNLNNGLYKVLLSTVEGVLGEEVPEIVLASGWVNTGEFIGLTAGNDGNANGIIQAAVTNSMITVNVNFGIEKRPSTGTTSATIQQNPGGEIFVVVPPELFVFADSDGNVLSIRLISFPLYADAIKVGNITYTSANFPAQGVVIEVSAQGELMQPVRLDPAEGAVTVPFLYKSTDDAGMESLVAGTVSMPFAGEYIPVDNLFPATGYGTLAFEDLWPGKGDYDFNDLVIDYQFELISNTGNYVDQIKANFIIKAFGASFENGFGFQLSSAIDPAELYVEGSQISENYVSLESNGVEAGQSKPTIIVYDNAYNEMEYPGTGIGVNTEQDKPYVEPVAIEIRIYFPENTYTFAQVDIANFNPFIMVNKDRGVEVHLPNYPPTDLVNTSMFGSAEDDSNPSTNRWYVNDRNLPWAINIYETFAYPIEKQEILWAHLKFAEWAMSAGDLFPDWYKNLSGYRNNELIYEVPED